jgi:hypothetical protein
MLFDALFDGALKRGVKDHSDLFASTMGASLWRCKELLSKAAGSRVGFLCARSTW